MRGTEGELQNTSPPEVSIQEQNYLPVIPKDTGEKWVRAPLAPPQTMFWFHEAKMMCYGGKKALVIQHGYSSHILWNVDRYTNKVKSCYGSRR